MHIEVFVLDTGHVTGGVRRAPRIWRRPSDKAVKFASGVRSEVATSG